VSVNGEERREPGGSGEAGGSRGVGKPGAFETFEFDAVDSAVLDWVQDLYAKTDPVPQDLLARVDFAMDPLGPDDTVALLQDDLFEAVGVRGTSASAEHSRTVTFDSESLTIVIQASPSGEALRVDGWLAPPAVHRVRLRAGERELQTESDELGGFVLTQVPHGLVQVIVEVGDAVEVGTADPPRSRTVVTTAVLL
jgi:hypothetical protein